MEPKINIYRATLADMKDVWVWRNDSQTREMSITTDEINWESHCEWFKASLSMSARFLFIGAVNDQKIGICRLDIDARTNLAEVSLNLNPAMRGKRISHLFLSAAVNKFSESSDAQVMTIIKKHNIPGIKCYSKGGFVCYGEDEETFYYKFTGKCEYI